MKSGPSIEQTPQDGYRNDYALGGRGVTVL